MSWDTWIRSSGETSWTAHRGLHEAGHRPLSAGSLRRAIASDVSRVEFDVLLHKGELVMAHDADDARTSPELLSLGEGLEILSQGHQGLSCDIKSAGGETEIADLLLGNGLGGRTLVCGHMKDGLQLLRETYPFPAGWSFPSYPTGTVPPDLSPEESQRKIYELVERGEADWCQGLMLRYDCVSPELVQLLHSKSKWVAAWTVDEPLVAQNLIRMGVDNITSNRPLHVRANATKHKH